MSLLKNPRLLILFFTMVVIMIGFGIIIPILPFYVEQFGAGGSELGMIMSVFSFMQFICSPYWGAMSDRYGRKRILMVGVLGNTISQIMIGLSGSLAMLFAARFLAGVLSSATFPTAMAYISDSTTNEERGGGMGVIGAAMGVGMVLGPGVGGWVSANSLSTPFFVAAGLSLVSLVLIALVLPESLPAEKRSPTTQRAAPVNVSLLWKALLGPLGFLFFLAFLVNFALANFEGIFGLYADHRYGYSPGQVGSIFIVIGVVSSLVQLLLTGPATKRFGEATIIKLSLAFSALGFALMVTAQSDLAVVLTVGFFVFSNTMLRPSIMSLTSKLSSSGQGVALGLNNSFQSLGRVVGPLWAGFTFDYNFNLPYVSASVLMLASLLFAIWKVRPVQAPLGSPIPDAAVLSVSESKD